MQFAKTVASLSLAAVSCAVVASGPQLPSHSQHTYSFTCPSGASGHLSYAEDSANGQPAQLSMWVNGQYVQDNPQVASALQGKAIGQMRGGCDGDKTTVLVQVSSLATAGQASWVTVLVSRSGQVLWVGA